MSVAGAVRFIEEENARLKEKVSDLETQLQELQGVPIVKRLPAGLKNYEFKLLRILLARDVVSTDSIMAALYGDGQVRGDSLIKVYVTRLRKWLRENCNAGIATEWGHGYYIPAEQKDRIREKIKEGNTHAERRDTAAAAVAAR